jgi:hypothetical protein
VRQLPALAASGEGRSGTRAAVRLALTASTTFSLRRSRAEQYWLEKAPRFRGS